ncbi:hypothetical protein OE88DRAFT_1737136 [Heliocybe sulcata]|uniref:Peptidase M20 dimerisation domain-containing protein n=1 Tax=Heliocybe sulcata TaxID=5364 RepID=A0A5C3N575_9AGAM|nr:hypothetical protein OE88DRAFT_1737136 [Heliocybe sulcata]
MAIEPDHTGCFAGLRNSFRSSTRKRPGSSERTSLYDKLSPPKPPLRDDDLAATTYQCWCCHHPLDPPHALEAPPAYSELAHTHEPTALKTIRDAVDKYSDDLRKLSMDIHDHPEIMFEERHAHDVLTTFLSAHGFTVTRHYLDLPTAWRAEYKRGTGGRTIGINSEMDALPGIGHGCGHNLIAMAGVAIALGVKAALDQHHVDGHIVLLGTPAEEGGAGKVMLLERGGYDGMHATHPLVGPPHSAQVGTSLAIQTIDVEFFGRTAHASAAPWEGQNALDAAFLTYSAISVLRQQIKPTHRVHGVIKGPSNLAANVIPDYTSMSWFVRAPSWTELEVLRKRVESCIEAGALASSCKVKISLGRAQYDLRQNPILQSGLASILDSEFEWQTLEGQSGGSTDFAMPALHPHFAIIDDPSIVAHTPGFRDAAATKKAHDAALTISKALAMIGFRVVDDEGFYGEVKEAFDKGQSS